MLENCEFVQKGFRILVDSLSNYIERELKRNYGNAWWNQVLSTLNDQWTLPSSGSDSDLINSLDIANCIRLLDRKWTDVFGNLLPRDCRSWARELMGVRNIVSHIGQQDIEQHIAERALDTMVLLCREIDPAGATKLETIYEDIRARSMVVYTGVAQPLSNSNHGNLIAESLLNLVGTEFVEKTTLTRRITYNGSTDVYPVYRVRLDYLYYNDQNDRIATWITKYESENGTGALSDLKNVEIYNRVIEDFIFESNPDAIMKTQRNISLVGQIEPGVTLADGRVVDGNRRFTCLRRIQRDRIDPPVYFETIIIDTDIREDKKQIKLLELATQHGEEKKVDYDLIDYAVGTYRDVVQTKLLTIDEYAKSANESKNDVIQRIEIAKVICEFLEYIKLPEQYHVAREFQVYSLFQEMMTPLGQLDDCEKQQLKKTVFNNVIMKAIPDQRAFIRDIKHLIKNGTYGSFFTKQQKLSDKINGKYTATAIHSKIDIDMFAKDNESITNELRDSMDNALFELRARLLKNNPAENITKAIARLMDVDSRLLARLGIEEKEKLKTELDELSRIVERFRNELTR